MARCSTPASTTSKQRLGLLAGSQVSISFADTAASGCFRDVVAGLALTALLVPQGMAYAELAGLPAVTGLYTSVLALLAYAVFGPSRIMVVGPDSALGPMIAAAILPLVAANGDPNKAIALASILALLMGAYCIVAGMIRVGTLAELFSTADAGRILERSRDCGAGQPAPKAVRFQYNGQRAQSRVQRLRPRRL